MQKLADIGFFEGLQNTQNAQAFGQGNLSSVDVFNDSLTVQAIFDRVYSEWNKMRKQLQSYANCPACKEFLQAYANGYKELDPYLADKDSPDYITATQAKEHIDTLMNRYLSIYQSINVYEPKVWRW